MSEFEGDGLSNEDFENSLKRFEEMMNTGEHHFLMRTNLKKS